MRARLLLLLAALLAPGLALAQGFAGLGAAAEGYETPRRDRALVFPDDHGPHPGFRIEWWYVTANLEGPDGEKFGAQFTLFRQAAAPPPDGAGWASQQYWLGHAALTTADRHLYAERTARGGVGQAGAVAAPFEAWVDAWRLGADPDRAGAPAALGLGALTLRAAGPDFGYDLALSTAAPPVLQGDDGYSVKSELGQASHYYSQPYFTAEGTVEIEGRRVAVTGRAWMDREWSTQYLSPDQPGWDWISLHLDEGTKLMLFRLRNDAGPDYVTGNWIEAGESTRIPAGDIEMTPVEWAEIEGRRAPVGWRVAVAGRGVSLTTTPLNPLAWNGVGIDYWEGPIYATGSHQAEGYLELTGY